MPDDEKYFIDFIRLPHVTLKTLGYDFLDQRRPRHHNLLMHIYLILSFICCVYCTYFVFDAILDEILAGVKDLPLLLRLINDFNYNFFGILKGIFFIWNVQKMKKIYVTFKRIFPTSQDERLAHQINEHYWPRWTRILLYLYFFATFFILFSPLAESIVEYLVDLIRFGFRNAHYPYHKMYEEQSYIVDHHQPLAYIVIYSMEALNGHFSIIATICPDIWLVAFIIQLRMHFDHISRSLEEYQPRVENAERDGKFIGTVAAKHQLLLELSDDVRSAYSMLVLIMVFSTVATLFCAGVYLTSQGLNRNLFGYLAFLPTTLGQYYMVCYFGQELVNKSLDVSVAAYNHSWYNGSQSYKKSILLILGRSQRQSEINAGGFQTTNLKEFEMVIRMTFQLFTVWRSMTNPE